jgi:hypothetical protein
MDRIGGKARSGEPRGGHKQNRIKKTQLDLFGTRASCRKFLANGLRLMFTALAYTLMQRLREIALAGTNLARAEMSEKQKAKSYTAELRNRP